MKDFKNEKKLQEKCSTQILCFHEWNTFGNEKKKLIVRYLIFFKSVYTTDSSYSKFAASF